VVVLSTLLVALFAADYLLQSRTAKAYQCDERGRLIKRVTPNGRSVQYQYDQAGLLTEVSYRRLGGVLGVPYPTGHSVQFEYDEAGNAISMKDALGRSRCVNDTFIDRAEARGRKTAVISFIWRCRLFEILK
jgi:YD repeat-containing protein